MITDNDSYGYERFRSLVQFYYSVCPETVMPFLLLYLAKEGELEIGERARTKAIQYTSEEERLKGVSLVRFTKEELIGLGDGGLCQLCKSCHFPNCTFGRY